MGQGAFRDLPEGFSSVTRNGWRIAFREAHRDAFATGGAGDPERLRDAGDARYRGRGRPCRVVLDDGTAGVLRAYRHGGLLRALTGGRFLGRPRPLRELVATERARRAGVNVPEILAAYVRPRAGIFHEGYLLTREIEGARDLVEVLGSGEPAGAALRMAGEETRRLHEAGVWHADLHVKNVLVGEGEVWLIDFDRARVADPVPAADRIGNLLRFDRSTVKLGRKGVRVGARDRLRFFHGYRVGVVDRRERDAVVRRCRRSLFLHRLGWTIFGTGR